MSDKQKTAVGYLLKELRTYEVGALLVDTIMKEQVKQAKEMEREQLMEAYKEGDDNGFMATESYNVGENAEKYISETYGE